MTTPYSPATTTAIAGGVTDRGWIEQDNTVTWDDGWASRYTLQNLAQQAGLFAVAARDRDAAFRRSALPTPNCGVRVLTVGDSITVGYGSADNTGWRGWLSDLIDQQRIRPLMSMHAHGGWRLADATPGLGAALAAATPDIVLLAMGTNEWLPDAPAQAAYQAAYGQAIDQVLASSPTAHVACALIPLSQQSTGIQPHETRANAAIQAAATTRAGTGRVLISDHRSTTSAPWTAYATDGSQPPGGRWTFDGVHPGDSAYLLMAQTWLATIQPWLPGSA